MKMCMKCRLEEIQEMEPSHNEGCKVNKYVLQVDVDT